MADVTQWTPDDAKTIREMINHETQLINHRLSWLATLQGFLFAALSVAWQNGQAVIPVFLVIVGVVSSVSVLMALIFADLAIQGLLNEWNKRSEQYKGPPVIGYALKRRYRFCLPWFVLPLLFAFTWVVLYFRK
jgi:hypothetical protein